jgi:predicted NBD/HSP70 family sugar kinase
MAESTRSRPDSTRRVVEAVLAQGETHPTYEYLAQVAGVSTRTVAHVIATLRERNLVRTGPARLGPAWGLVLSVALGEESCRAGLVDANGALFHELELTPHPEQAKLDPQMLLARIERAARRVLDRARIDPELAIDGKLPLIGVATAWPCPVRGSKRAAGAVLHTDWSKHKPSTLHEAVAAALGCPPEKTHALNDANAHALAVVFDKARARAADPDDHAGRIDLVLRLGGGLGAATMIGQPHRRARLCFIDSIMLGGARSLAGELAHLPIESSLVAELNGRAKWVDGLAPLSMDWRCSCGQPGHLGALASGTAWARRMAESEIRVWPLREGARRSEISQTNEALAKVADPRITYALEDLGRLIGRSLASPIMLLDPHSLTLTGSFAVKWVLEGIMAERETWRNVFGDGLSIELFGGPAPRYVGVRGAALAVLRRHVYRRFAECLERNRLGSGHTFFL